MKYKVWPEEFDPVIAAGPPSEDYLRVHLTWTKEDTERHRLLETQFTIWDVATTQQLPPNCVRMRMEE